MKDIKLKKLELTNYRNIPYLLLNFDGNSKIVGDNRIGKTNTLEAIYYLLTDYLLGGDSDVAKIKPLDDTKKVVSVEGLFEVINENQETTEVSIKKEYKENWVKTRGTSDLVFKGHETTYYFNNVKQATLKAYNQLLLETFGIKKDDSINIDFLKMLVDPFYLGNIGESKDWTNLRQFIIKLVGDVSDDDVFNQNANLLPIKNDLKMVNGKVDQIKKQYAQNINSLKDQILQDDAKINLLEQTEKPTDADVAIAKKGIEEHDINIANLRNQNGKDEASALIEKQIYDIDNKISSVKLQNALKQKDSESEKLKQALQNEINENYSKLNEIFSKSNSVKISSLDTQNTIQSLKNEIEKCNATRTNLINQLKEIDRKIKDHDGLIKECPTCHRPFSEEDINNALNNLIASLNKQKAELIEKGKENNTNKEYYESQLKHHEETLAVSEQELDNINAEIAKIDDLIKSKKAELNNIPTTEINVDSKELDDLLEQKNQLEQDLKESKIAFANNSQDINSKIYQEQEAKKPYQKVLDDLSYYERQQIELSKVNEKKVEHSKNLIDYEQKKEMLNQFTKIKLSMLDSNVAKVFGNIKFQLIQENINGGYDAICKVYIYDIDKNASTKTTWKSGSKSERVITGIAILEKIKEHLQLPNLPLLFDEGGEISAETFASKLKTNAQIICVKVEDNIFKPTIIKIN